MNETEKHHLARLRGATTSKYSRADLARWVTENTYLNGRRYSTKGHEYQAKVMGDTSPDISIIKPSQIGCSEMSLRLALGLVYLMPSFSLIYTLPTATMAALYTKTRLDPIIASSPLLKAATRGELDSSEAKQLGEGSFLYTRGLSSNSVIGFPADALVIDELDFSDQLGVEQLNSRLTHSPYKWRIRLSTPTTPGGPIDEAVKQSMQWVNLVNCEHCGTRFRPSYWDHVKIPGYTGHLEELTAENLRHTRYKEAQLRCPHCDKNPSLQPDHREWVCLNPDAGYSGAGYILSPFDAPSFITPVNLIESSVKYERRVQFKNFHLGETAEDSETGLMVEDVNAIGKEMVDSPFPSHVMGCDLGKFCHFVVAGVGSDRTLGVVHYERVPLARFRERYFALKAQFRVSIVCSDQYPYTDMIMSLSGDDPNLYGCSYTSRNGLDLFDIKRREMDPDSALGALRQVGVNRSAIFDKLMVEIREGRIWIRKSQDWDLFKAHLLDQRRVAAVLRNGEMMATWTKSSKGQDHYAHALGYAFIAAQMRGIASGALSAGPPLVGKFKVKSK